MNRETRLREVGDVLEQAFAADLRAQSSAPGRARGWPRRLHRRGRLLAAGAALIVVGVPGAAVAAAVLATTPAQVAADLPAGERLFAGHPATCTTVRVDAEYRCKLVTPPAPDRLPTLSEGQQNELETLPRALWRVRGELNPVERDEMRGYRYRLLVGFGWTDRQAAEYTTGDVPAQGIAPGQFRGVVLPTVDSTHHVDGGCRATDANGSTWDCYVGEAAIVENVIVGPLGTYLPAPSQRALPDEPRSGVA